MLVSLELVRIDAASFVQIRDECNGDADAVARHILALNAERGKIHNPVTDSGGIFIGRVEAVGSAFAESHPVRVGDRVASLTSLSALPLQLDQIKRVHLDTHELEANGHAVMFTSSPFMVLPDDLHPRLALAACDVAGAPAFTAEIVRPGDTVAIVGAGGLAGLLCLHEARKHTHGYGQIIAIDASEKALDAVRATGLADHCVLADATEPVGVLRAYLDTGVKTEADVTINVASVPGTEHGSVLITKSSGTIVFFSMATNFTRAALGAEAVGKTTRMYIGNGLTRDRGSVVLQTLSENEVLRNVLCDRLGIATTIPAN